MSNLKMTKYCIVFYIFDENDRFLDTIILGEKISSDSKENGHCDLNTEGYPKTFAAVFKVDGYFLSFFHCLLNISPDYSKLVTNNFVNTLKQTPGNSEINIKFQLVRPKLEILDYAWNDRMCNLIVERQELEHAMSWLSTLGGAFSALGDSFEKCAQVAGKISIQQFKIAFRLGEPPLIARCKLYMALSLLQLGKLGIAKNLIQEQYSLAKTLKDFRLQNMCKGVWAKLQYIYKQKKEGRGKTEELKMYFQSIPVYKVTNKR